MQSGDRSGRFSGEKLAKLLTSRGVELKRKGDLGGARADFNAALAAPDKYDNSR